MVDAKTGKESNVGASRYPVTGRTYTGKRVVGAMLEPLRFNLKVAAPATDSFAGSSPASPTIQGNEHD